MIREIEFELEGRVYRATVRPMPDGGAEFEHGAWFVSMNDGPERRLFEANPDDTDTPDLRHRIVVATWLIEEYNRRHAQRRAGAGAPAAGEGERRSEGDRRGAATEG